MSQKIAGISSLHVDRTYQNPHPLEGMLEGGEWGAKGAPHPPLNTRQVLSNVIGEHSSHIDLTHSKGEGGEGGGS